MRRLVMAAALGMLLLPATALAEPATYCVKATKTAGKPKHYTGAYDDKDCTVTDAAGEGKFDKITPSALSESETEELKTLLKYVRVQASGVGGKPTVQFHDSNVQVVSGAGNEGILNGEGNLVVGYNEAPRAQTGSNNIVVGGGYQSFTSFGGLIAGFDNTATGEDAVVFGRLNTASGKHATVTGGQQNVASDEDASVVGGISNEATKNQATVAGGSGNIASTAFSFIGGGASNKATGVASAILGGLFDVASGEEAAVVGGREGEASGRHAAILGGAGVKVTAENGHAP